MADATTAVPGGRGAKVMVCDDDATVRWALQEQLNERGFRAVMATDGRDLLDRVDDESPALVLLDLKMPRMGGLDTLAELRRRGSTVPVVVLTATGGVQSAMAATRLGACGWVEKPWSDTGLARVIRESLAKAERARLTSVAELTDDLRYGEFVGGAAALRDTYATLRRLESVDAPAVLILGETGTGKDVIAREIHRHGRRSDKPFVTVDCSSLPESLIESELFGHERGAFTDAKEQRRGLFEVAEGGVVFLDEVGELPITTQAKLLRALENRTFRRVGGVRQIGVDICVIAATNRRLFEEVTRGRFRQDLYYRLDVVNVKVPPLRTRKEDIPLLTGHLLGLIARRLGCPRPQVTLEAIDRLAAYPWPGNVRELRNVLERMTLLGGGSDIDVHSLPSEIRFAAGSATGRAHVELPPGGVRLQDVEESLLRQAMARTRGNLSAAAKLVGLTRETMRYRVRKLNIES